MKPFVLAVFVVAFGATVHAQQPADKAVEAPAAAETEVTRKAFESADYPRVRERLSTILTGESEVSIAESALPGLLQVQIGADIVYMTDEGRYLFQGRVIDLETRQDLTDQAMSQVRRKMVGQIDHDELIAYGPDDAAHSIVVFTDVDCGYCRRLHQQVAEYNEAGIRIEYAAFPRAGIGSESFNKMVSVWCADDQQAAMDLAKGGGTPEPEQCEAPVQAQYQFGQRLGVTGTPALVTADGDLIPGYVPPADLRVRLDQLASRARADSANAE